MTKYAATTEVPADKSRSEIERTLTRYGASVFMYGWEDTRVIVGFKMRGRQIKFMLQLPDPQAKEFRFTAERGYLRSDTARRSRAFSTSSSLSRLTWSLFIPPYSERPRK